MNEQSEILDTKETCKLLAVDRHTLTKLIANEGLPVHQLSTRVRRFRRSELMRWFDEKRQTAKGE